MQKITVYNPRTDEITKLQPGKMGRNARRNRIAWVRIGDRHVVMVLCFVRRGNRYCHPACHNVSSCCYSREQRDRGKCRGRCPEGCRHNECHRRCELFFVEEGHVRGLRE